jgi:aerobic-type carbon monoxide dehydrogenase small subunit (CoxS/CutS family)
MGVGISRGKIELESRHGSYDMDLVINGQRRHVNAEPTRPLLFILRNELDLTGTKYGCGEGRCGACTVIFEGVATRSCQIPFSDAAGKEITTIEGLADVGRLHPVQQAFIDCDAMQCGYCTPGMVLSSVALLRKNPAPSDVEIKTALEGNICRCGAYNRIIAAVHKAAKQISAAGIQTESRKA